MSIKETFLSLSGWYTSQLRADSDGVWYVTMHYIGPAEYDDHGNSIIPDDDFAYYRNKGENVGDAVVYYHGFNSLLNHETA